MDTTAEIKDINIKKEFLKYELNNDNYRFLRQELTKYNQHGSTTIFYHCRHVAYYSYRLAMALKKHFNADIDIKSMINAAYMHDLFMYDWHEKGGNHKLHGYTHSHTAATNAKEYCNATEIEQKIIETHMWPLTATKIPRSKEAWIVCLCDKYSALKETFKK